MIEIEVIYVLATIATIVYFIAKKLCKRSYGECRKVKNKYKG